MLCWVFSELGLQPFFCGSPDKKTECVQIQTVSVDTSFSFDMSQEEHFQHIFTV